MTDGPKNIFDSISKWGAFLTPVGIVIVIALQSQFVSRKEFADTDERLRHVEVALVQIVEQNRVNDRQDAELSDHEHRLRDLEHIHSITTP
jgi:hypothetical protein